jgi:hypothetical protein
MYNTQRWVFGSDSVVIYRHKIGNIPQQSASVEPTIGWHTGGELAVDAGIDGKDWKEIGVLSGLMTKSFEIPASLLPANEVWIRLRGRNTDKPASFQVYGYTYRAMLAQDAGTLSGSTHFVGVPQSDPRVQVVLDNLGEAIPGGANVLHARVENKTGQPLNARPTLRITPAGGQTA